MPELPEVETTVRGLERVLEGRRHRPRSSRGAPTCAVPFPPDLGQRLTGARVTGLGRRAKYGLIDTDRGDTLIFHLGMSGRWRIDPDEIGKHDHLLIETDDGRRAGAERSAPVRLARSGARPPTLDALAAVRRARARAARAEVADAHLQRALAGRKRADQAAAARPADRRRARQHLRLRGAVPGADRSAREAGGSVSPARLERLVPAIREVLERGDRGRRIDPARLSPPRWRARLFLQAASRSMAARARPAALRRDRAAHRPGRALHLLLPAAASGELA